MTETGRGVAWKSWNPRRNRAEAILFSIATYLNRSSQARGMTEAGRGVAWKSWNLRRNRIGQEFLSR